MRGLRVLLATALVSTALLGQAGAPGQRAGAATTASGPKNRLGSAVAISGSTAVVGAPGERQDTGVALIFARTHGKWHKLQTLTDPRAAQLDFYGQSAAIAGSELAVGLPLGNVVFYYARSKGTWHLRQTLHDPETASTDSFGSTLAISGSTLVIGSPSTGFDFGTTYIYRLAGTRWVLQATLNDPPQQTLDLFGRALAMLGQQVLIGAVGDAYVYSKSAHGWSKTATISNPGTAGDNFGAAIAAAGTTAVIGAPGNVPGTPFTTAPGAAYIYGESGSSWTLRQSLPPPQPGSFFGFSAAMTASTILLGMPWYGTITCGAVFEFVRSGTSWQQKERLGVPGCKGGDQFGDELALSGTTAIVGAPFQNVETGAFYFRNLG